MKLINLNKAIDLKLDRASAIVRKGTPLIDLIPADLPSPTANANRNNIQTLPFQFTFKTLKPKLDPDDPDEYEEKPCQNDKVKVLKTKKWRPNR